MPHIVAHKLEKQYALGKETIFALMPVDLEIEKGEMIAIMGRSGSGKSTLLQLIGGLDSPTRGTITVDGVDLSSMNDHDRSMYRNNTVGFVFQFFYLQPYLTVSENVQIPLIFRGEPIESRERKAEEALKSVGLEEMAQRLPNQLSGGQMQRVAIARAIVHEPQILLADEPTGNLDEKTGEEIMTLLKNLNREHNTTLIIVTHDSDLAAHASRVITVANGVISTKPIV